MLLVIALLSFALWTLGLETDHRLGGMIHLLIVVAGVSVGLNLLRSSRSRAMLR